MSQLPDECPRPVSGLPEGGDGDRLFQAGAQGRRIGESCPEISARGKFRPLLELHKGWVAQDDLAKKEGYA